VSRAPRERIRRESITVRHARRADIGRIAELLTVFTGSKPSTRAATNRFDLISGDPEQSLFVATARGHVVGLLGFRIRHNLDNVSHYGEVSAIAVDPDWRKQGVGGKLLQHAEKVARKRRCIGLWLVSGYGREEAAHRFYDRAGFSRTGIRFVKLFDFDDERH
jgi:ribosomal protein S18 acetylase RimI-like enzyme